MKPTRGERNNNPGNIVKTANKWRGEKQPGDDPKYCQFDTPHYGIRALARILLNYQLLHGLRTVRQMISRWAPPAENNTDAYINAVSTWLDVEPDDVYELGDDHNLAEMIRAIIRQENGRCIYPIDVLDNAATAAK